MLPEDTLDNANDVATFGLDRPFATGGLTFTAIDFETATREPDSVCEIGIAIVDDGVVTDCRSWLVRPIDNRYEWFNTRVHGIRPEDTAVSPTFEAVWQEVLPLLQGRVVVAHNAAFDMGVLRETLTLRHIEFPELAYFCSCRVAKKAVRGGSHSLERMCSLLGVDPGRHHRAGDDARACAEVFVKCVGLCGATSFASLQRLTKTRCGRFAPAYFRPQRKT